MPAAQDAIEENPANRPAVDTNLTPDQLAALTTAWWGPKGVDLGVAFLDNPPADLRARIISHMNAWNARGANIRFREASLGMAQVRIARNEQSYWSYLGTGVLRVPRNQPTMMLGRFTMNTPDREFIRVVRHETGHTLAYPHEQLRRAIVSKLNVQAVLEEYRRVQGWSEATTRANVLTPVEESILRPESSPADRVSIMTYRIPARLTLDGVDIPGGDDINDQDYLVTGRLYPGAVTPPPPPPPPTAGILIPATGSYHLTTGADGKKTLIFGG